MGCGTSKASEIDEKCITIKPSPKKAALGQTESNQVQLCLLAYLSFLYKEGPVTSDHLNNGNNAARAPVATNGSETAIAADPTNKYPPPVAFDVPLNEDGTPMEKKNMPRKLQVLMSIDVYCIIIVHIENQCVSYKRTVGGEAKSRPGKERKGEFNTFSL